MPDRFISNQRVFSGKTFSKAEYETKFVGGTGKEIPYKSFVSSSLDREVAEGFIELTAKHADDVIMHCESEAKSKEVLESIKARLQKCKLGLHEGKTKIVYCQNYRREKKHIRRSLIF